MHGLRRLSGLGIAVLAIGLMGAAQTPRWTVAPQGSAISLSMSALGTTQAGRFETWSSDIRFDPARPEAARVEIDVRTASLRMRQSVMTNRAVSPAFLDAANHPSIRFRLRDLAPTGPDRYDARADLTVKGRTRTVAFPVTLSFGDTTATMAGQFVLDRAAFDIGTSGALDRMVSRQITVDVRLQARLASATPSS